MREKEREMSVLVTDDFVVVEEEVRNLRYSSTTSGPHGFFSLLSTSDMTDRCDTCLKRVPVRSRLHVKSLIQVQLSTSASECFFISYGLQIRTSSLSSLVSILTLGEIVVPPPTRPRRPTYLR